MDNQKRCSKCKEWKDRSAFSKDATRKDGLCLQCKTCIAAYNTFYNRTHVEKRAAYRAEHRKDKATYRAEHREEIAAYYAAYYAEHRAEIASKYSAWQKANPDKMRAKNHRRRARKTGNGGTHTADDIKRQGDSQSWKCWWRGPGCLIDCKDKYHVDHLVPLSRGGHNNPSNLVISCPVCNLKKLDKLPHEFLERLL